jgi:hypothetical protein
MSSSEDIQKGLVDVWAMQREKASKKKNGCNPKHI